MKFIFADSLDMVDPAYDFIKDVNGPGRRIAVGELCAGIRQYVPDRHDDRRMQRS